MSPMSLPITSTANGTENTQNLLIQFPQMPVHFEASTFKDK